MAPSPFRVLAVATFVPAPLHVPSSPHTHNPVPGWGCLLFPGRSLNGTTVTHPQLKKYVNKRNAAWVPPFLALVCLPLSSPAIKIYDWSGGVFFFCVFPGPHQRHMELPRLRVQSELWPPAYARATATQNQSHNCDLHHSSGQHQMSEARDWASNLMVPSQIRAKTGTPKFMIMRGDLIVNVEKGNARNFSYKPIDFGPFQEDHKLWWWNNRCFLLVIVLHTDNWTSPE